MKEGHITPMSPWLESLEFRSSESTADASLAVRTLGLAYVGQWKEGLFPSKGLSLPIRQDWVQGDEGVSRAPKKRLGPSSIQWLNERLETTLKLLNEWPPFADFETHMHHIRQLATLGLGWSSKGPADHILGALQIRSGEQKSPPMSRGEAAAILDSLLQGELQGPRTEERSGVKVLDGTRARGLTFQHVFICQVNRGIFPRVVSEDPLLPDRIRLSLQPLMPELAPKSRGHDEERFLFAQLFGSAKHVTVSWMRADDEGKELGRSVLVDRLLLSRTELTLDSIPRDLNTVVRRSGQGVSPLVPPESMALVHALEHREENLSPWLALSLEESAGLSPEDALQLAEFRSRALSELSPNKATPEGRRKAMETGVFLGDVGPISAPWDPRNRPMSVTSLEDMANCPWHFWLKRMLQLEATPIPTMAPPDIPASLVGTIVHDTLEDLITAKHPELRGRTWDKTTAPAVLRCPTPKNIIQATKVAAERTAAANGIRSTGTWRLLTLRALPFVQRSVSADWPEPDSELHVIATESRGVFNITDPAGNQVAISFKADRVDKVRDGWRLVDYKTGKPVVSQKREKDRRRNLIKALSSGKMLQGMGYSMSTSEGVGTYRYLSEKATPASIELTLSSEDEELKDIFEETTGTLHAGISQGVFFPRLEDPGQNPPSKCTYCEFVEACAKNDSGRRERIRNSGALHMPTGPLKSDSTRDEIHGHLFHLGFPTFTKGEE